MAAFGYEGSPSDIKPKRANANRFRRMELPLFVRKIDADGIKRSSRDIALRIMARKASGQRGAGIARERSPSGSQRRREVHERGNRIPRHCA